MAAPDEKQIKKMHQYFAVECNNRAWELAEQASRTSEENQELTITAHAAAYHWGKVGMPINEARARQLLAEVYAQAGDGPRALALAEECRAFFLDEEGATEWDRAFASLELAYAHAVNGNKKRAGELLEEAAQQGEQLAEKGEREFFQESHQRISANIAAL